MLLKWNRATLSLAIPFVTLSVHARTLAVEKEPAAVVVFQT